MLADRPSRAAGDHTKLTPHNPAMAPTSCTSKQMLDIGDQGHNTKLSRVLARPSRATVAALQTYFAQQFAISNASGKRESHALAMSLPGQKTEVVAWLRDICFAPTPTDDISQTGRHVRFVPTHAPQQKEYSIISFLLHHEPFGRFVGRPAAGGVTFVVGL